MSQLEKQDAHEALRFDDDHKKELAISSLRLLYILYQLTEAFCGQTVFIV